MQYFFILDENLQEFPEGCHGASALCSGGSFGCGELKDSFVWKLLDG